MTAGARRHPTCLNNKQHLQGARTGQTGLERPQPDSQLSASWGMCGLAGSRMMKCTLQADLQ